MSEKEPDEGESRINAPFHVYKEENEEEKKNDAREVTKEENTSLQVEELKEEFTLDVHSILEIWDGAIQMQVLDVIDEVLNAEYEKNLQL